MSWINGLKRQLSKIDWISYIWLVYVPVNLTEFMPVKNLQDQLWLGLGALFVLSYVLVVEFPRYRNITIPVELGICGIFSLFAANNYMSIFPAWQIPFILAQTARGRRAFKWFVSAYELLIIAGFARSGLITPAALNLQNGQIVGAIFPMISPWMSFFFAKEIYANRAMRQKNRRLEALIQRDERERIARDLHDTLGQSFSMITVKTELAKKLLVKAPQHVAAELDDIEATSRQNLQMVRTIVNDLHQQSLSEVLLLQGKALAAANVALVTAGEMQAMQWPTEVQAHFAATIQEALTNVIRHAHAGKVTVSFRHEAGVYTVTIQDDGDGKHYERAQSNGVAGMQSRLASLNGDFKIASNRIGTLVTMKIPEGERV